MQLVKPSDTHLKSLENWFSNEQEVFSWAGPGLSYPIDRKNLYSELKIDTLPTYVMENQGVEFIGFGQFYERVSRCHFGRLAISPDHRGLGHIASLIALLGEYGQQRLGLSAQSLFVLPDNSSAIKAYKNLGFNEALYPEESPLADCLYMIRDSL